MAKYIYITFLIFFVSCSSSKVITENDLIYSSNFENLNNFGSFLWAKNKKDSIFFNKKNIKIIKTKKGMYYRSLLKYISFLTRSKDDIRDISFSEKAKVIAYLINVSKEIDPNTRIIQYTILDDKNKEFFNEFEKENYYELNGLKEDYRIKLKELTSPLEETIPIKVFKIK